MNHNDSRPLPVPASSQAPQVSANYSDDPAKIAELWKWMADATPPNFHHWCLPAARRCQQNGISAEGAFSLLRNRANEHSRLVSSHDISRDIRTAYGDPRDSVPTFHKEPSRYKATPHLTIQEKVFLLKTSTRWPKCPPADLHKFIDQNFNVMRNVPDLPPAHILEVLYGNFRCMGYYLVFGKMYGDVTSHQVVLLDEVLNSGTVPEGYPLVVPNLATKPSGHTANGKPSTRSRDMFQDDRAYLVVESDIGEDEMDTQFALIHLTAAFLERDPALVMHSGNKSLHSWWRVDGLSEKQIINYFNFAAPAIDRSTLATNQLVRVPNTNRQMTGSNPGRRQVALYLDPFAVAMPPGVERPWAIEDRPFIFRSEADSPTLNETEHPSATSIGQNDSPTG